MRIAIHQPHYFPNLAYFYKIAKCDIFVFLDTAQYVKGNWINRNKIKTPTGWQWLTVPVSYMFGDQIQKVKLSNAEWLPKHVKSLSANYNRAPYARETFEVFPILYWLSLSNMNQSIITNISSRLHLDCIFVQASGYRFDSVSTEFLVNITKHMGGTQYMSGLGAKKYMDESLFEKAGIELVYTDFKHPEYNQLWGDFIPNLSILDLLFNHGFEGARKILLGE